MTLNTRTNHCRVLRIQTHDLHSNVWPCPTCDDRAKVPDVCPTSEFTKPTSIFLTKRTEENYSNCCHFVISFFFISEL